MYKCVVCKKEFEKVEFVNCPFCRSKILFKVTPPVAKKVKAE